MNVEVLSTYSRVKNIPYGWPLFWSYSRKKAHCGIKSEILASMLRKKGYDVRFAVGYRCGMIPRFWPKFLDVHFWVEVNDNGRWITLDPTPDSVVAHFVGDVLPGEHLGEPEHVHRVKKIPVWYKDIYNSWLLLPYKLMVNIGLLSAKLYSNVLRHE